MARTNKKQMLDNLYERVKRKSFTNEDVMAIVELEKIKTMEREPDEVKEAICWYIESCLFNSNYTKDEQEKYLSLLKSTGYIK
jgi:2C-methyl-D-erythritol 2,4-cyclodiphosphate synthase